ncbi:hypothetical protein P5V78_21960 [Mycobacteroides abscessus subsp. abscessus]|nr:hypothetical protein [Mycobacteroides abscessus]QPO17375.1 hypothetical protein PHIGD24-3_1 [Mycobacterium phage phiGD24-3]QSM02231.1 hypothetical protein PROPHIGD24-3_57 [Mycobacterium phage prophiGD24-3]ETZ60883.1 hypothetical protein L836_2307 [Mycobacteroides abscessus MAB_110811_2726]EUA84252.1 hypothetical protein I541_1042 [Mycobacteroides abscessus]MDO3090658.1 hypothetical protein [Mycobacteroides abscessus subsp. abscessus]
MLKINYHKTTHGNFRKAIDYADDRGRQNERLHALRIFGILILW